MNPWLYDGLAIVLIACAFLCWLSNLFGLPGNWALLAVVAAFAYFLPEGQSHGLSGKTLLILLALAVLGEIVEFAAGARGAAKEGASRRSMLLAVIGGIAGSMIGATAGLPIPLVGSMAGAMLGGSAGAFAGAYLGELSVRRPHAASVAVARSAFVGRFWGTIGKFAVGAAMLGVTAVAALYG